jgi:hypothetical protein
MSTPRAEGQAAPADGNGAGEDGQGQRSENGAADALNRAGGSNDPIEGASAARCRPAGEDRQPDDQQPSAAEASPSAAPVSSNEPMRSRSLPRQPQPVVDGTSRAAVASPHPCALTERPAQLDIEPPPRVKTTMRQITRARTLVGSVEVGEN